MANDRTYNKMKRWKDIFYSKRFWLSDYAIISYIALLNFAMHLIAIKGFGYFRDELYYIACSNHLDLGYVDQPPLSILLLKLVRLVFGDSLIAIRILPVLGSAFIVFFTGLIAKELGGKKFALILASIAAFAPIGNFFFFSIYSMNFLDFLFWQSAIYTVIKIIKTDNPKYWLLFGLIVGLGLENKISVLFLCCGIVTGILLTKKRKFLKSKYLWLGVAISGLLFLPYVLWNTTHDWATLEFMHNAKTLKMADVSPLGFLTGQILYNNPPTLIIWLAGLIFFFFNKEGKKYSLFGWMFLSIYILFTLQEAKDYYLAPAYPILFAGGAVQFERWLRKKNWNWLKPLMVVSILVPTLILCPMTLPIFPVEKTVSYIQSLGIESSPGERHEMGVLPQHFADMHGWEDMVATVAQTYRKLPKEDQSQCIIFVRNYGEAGAIDFFGKKYDLPKATCSHNNYWLWGPPKDKTIDVAIIFGTSRNLKSSYEDLTTYFGEVKHAATFQCTYCMPYENNRPIFICRGFNVTIQDIWESQKHYE